MDAGSKLTPRAYAANVGDGHAITFHIAHDLGTRDVFVQVYQNAEPHAQVDVEVRRVAPEYISLGFFTPPSPDEFRVLVVRVG